MRGSVIAGLFVAWVLAVGSGIYWLGRYKATPGGAAADPSEWPTASAIPRADGLATVVMLAHPECPCTAASLDELERVMTRVEGRATAHVLFIRPVDAPPEWDGAALWRRALRIPGVRAAWDDEGREAHHFGALTSGQTVAYDGAGRRIFSGGITGSRGHVGDNAGRDRLVAALLGQPADGERSAVFGCALEDPRTTEAKHE